MWFVSRTLDESAVEAARHRCANGRRTRHGSPRHNHGANREVSSGGGCSATHDPALKMRRAIALFTVKEQMVRADAINSFHRAFEKSSAGWIKNGEVGEVMRESIVTTNYV